MHFVFGLRPQVEPFHLVHYLAIASCRAVVQPDDDRRATATSCRTASTGTSPARWSSCTASTASRGHRLRLRRPGRRATTPTRTRPTSCASTCSPSTAASTPTSTPLFVAPVADELWDAPCVIGREADVLDPAHRPLAPVAVERVRHGGARRHASSRAGGTRSPAPSTARGPRTAASSPTTSPVRSPTTCGSSPSARSTRSRRPPTASARLLVEPPGRPRRRGVDPPRRAPVVGRGPARLQRRARTRRSTRRGSVGAPIDLRVDRASVPAAARFAPSNRPRASGCAAATPGRAPRCATSPRTHPPGYGDAADRLVRAVRDAGVDVEYRGWSNTRGGEDPGFVPVLA